MTNITVSGMDINNVLKRCLELENRGYECISKIQMEYKAPKQYHTRIDSNPRLNRTTFAGTEEIVKYRAIYRKAQ